MTRPETDEIKKDNHPNFFWRIIGLLFPKFNLHHPIYVIIPFLILIVSMNIFLAMTRNSYSPFELQITSIALLVFCIFAMFFDIMIMIKQGRLIQQFGTWQLWETSSREKKIFIHNDGL